MVLNNKTDYKTENFNKLSSIIGDCETLKELDHAITAVEELMSIINISSRDENELYSILSYKKLELAK